MVELIGLGYREKVLDQEQTREEHQSATQRVMKSVTNKSLDQLQGGFEIEKQLTSRIFQIKLSLDSTES